MPTLIKKVRDKNLVTFDRGGFDEWCVFLQRPGWKRYAPKDTEYFTRLQQLGVIHGQEKIYNDFVKYYTFTTAIIDAKVLNGITRLADTYGADAEEIDTWFTVIYAGMVAEENKTHAVLKKRIKRLGMHQVLIEGFDPAFAANFSRGRNWRELDAMMKERDF